MTFLNNHQNDNVTFAIIPNAYAIMPEKLPAGLEQIDQLALIQEAYAQAPESAGIVDFSGTLTEHKDEYIYYRTDHHWTTLGAYYAYAQLMQQLGQGPVALSELDGKTVENFYGTYFSKAKKFDAQADTITYYEIPDAGVTIDGKEQDGYYDFSKFEVRDKYAAFLRGNNGYTVIKSGVRTVEEGQEPSRILIIKDSYANSFAPFLLCNYDEVHIVDLRYLAGSLSQLINEGGFDEILLMYNFSNLVTIPISTSWVINPQNRLFPDGGEGLFFCFLRRFDKGFAKAVLCCQAERLFAFLHKTRRISHNFAQSRQNHPKKSWK